MRGLSAGREGGIPTLNVERNSVAGPFGALRASGSLRSLTVPITLHPKRGLKPFHAEKLPPPCFKPRLGSLAWDAAGTALPRASMPRLQTHEQAFLSSPPPAHPRRFNPTKTTHAPSPNHDGANETILKGVQLLKEKLHGFKSYTAQSSCTGGFHAARYQRVLCTNATPRPSSVTGLFPR